MRTVEDARSGVIQAGPLRASLDDLHLSVAPWLTAELEAVGIHATTAFIPAPLRIPEVAPDLPEAFGVLTYLPNHRFAFFGGEIVMETARRLPDVRFDVVAGTAEAAPSAPPNVHWHGWVTNMAERYRESTVVVRVPRHDGFGNSVIEGLLNARHVIYTHAVPFVQLVSPVTDDALTAAIGSVFAAHLEGVLIANTAGRDYAVEAFDPVRLGNELRALLRANS